MDSARIKALVLSTVNDFIADWGQDDTVTPDTKIVGDLEFDSIDVIQLTVALDSAFGSRKIGFQNLLMQDGRYVDDLTVAQFQDFVETQLPPA